MIFINYKNPHPIYKNRQSINEIEHIYYYCYKILMQKNIILKVSQCLFEIKL